MGNMMASRRQSGCGFKAEEQGRRKVAIAAKATRLLQMAAK
jgi:hypothetical protein